MQKPLKLDGARIRTLRVQRSWPQEQLARIAEVSPRTIQRVEAGGNASYETLRALASAFEIEAKALLDEQPVTTPQRFREGTAHKETEMTEPNTVVRSRTRNIMTGTLWAGLLAGTISFLVYLPQLLTTGSGRATRASHASPAPFLTSPGGEALPGSERQVKSQAKALVIKKRPVRQRRTTQEIARSPIEVPDAAPPNFATSLFLVTTPEADGDQASAPRLSGAPTQELAVADPIITAPEPDQEAPQTAAGVATRTKPEAGSGHRTVSETARQFSKRTAGFFSRLGASMKKSF